MLRELDQGDMQGLRPIVGLQPCFPGILGLSFPVGLGARC